MTDKARNDIRIPDDPKEAAALLVKLQKQKKFAGLLGIAKKAGRVIAGTNLVTDSIRSTHERGSPIAVPITRFPSIISL